jgi:hypothetical protein
MYYVLQYIDYEAAFDAFSLSIKTFIHKAHIFDKAKSFKADVRLIVPLSIEKWKIVLN